MSCKFKNCFINYFVFFSFLVFFISFFSKTVFAQVVINEFSFSTTSDWVEVYNTGEPVDISSLVLVDGDGNQKVFPSCVLRANETYAIDFSNRLDNGGDRIGLMKDAELIDCVSYKSGSPCDGKAIDLPDLGSNEFGVRQPEGTGSWGKTSVSTKSDNSSCSLPTPTVTNTLTPFMTPILPTSTITPSLTITPAQKATYKINKAKDESGTELSNVKIYVDDQYTHHVDDETLIFCSGCHCDDEHNVDCELGQHIIRLEKDGYENWGETRTFNAGDNFEVNPVMAEILPSSNLTATPIPTSTPTVKLTPTKTPTPKLSGSPTPTGGVLGEESASESGGFKLSGGLTDEENIQPTPGANAPSKRFKLGWSVILPLLVAILGMGFIGFSVFFFLKMRKQQKAVV